jgi:hypothetical protein
MSASSLRSTLTVRRRCYYAKPQPPVYNGCYNVTCSWAGGRDSDAGISGSRAGISHAHAGTLQALGNMGKAEQALFVLRKCWGGMIALGATTFWETFAHAPEYATHSQPH